MVSKVELCVFVVFKCRVKVGVEGFEIDGFEVGVEFIFEGYFEVVVVDVFGEMDFNFGKGKVWCWGRGVEGVCSFELVYEIDRGGSGYEYVVEFEV